MKTQLALLPRICLEAHRQRSAYSQKYKLVSILFSVLLSHLSSSASCSLCTLSTPANSNRPIRMQATFKSLFFAILGLRLASSAPVNELASRQSDLTVPAGQGYLNLIDPTTEQVVGCIGYYGRIEAGAGNPSCYQYMQAVETADLKSAAFQDGAGPCTFYPFSDSSYNYTCNSESIAYGQDYVNSAFQVSLSSLPVGQTQEWNCSANINGSQEYPNGTLLGNGPNGIFVYADSVTSGETISIKPRAVPLLFSFEYLEE